jgi:hypothetical protein
MTHFTTTIHPKGLSIYWKMQERIVGKPDYGLLTEILKQEEIGEIHMIL